MGQAKKLAETQNGSIDGWDFGETSDAEAAAQFWNYLKPHLTVTKDCGTETDCYDNDVFHLNGTNAVVDYRHTNYYKFILSDGSVMWFRTSSPKCNANLNNILTDICAYFFYDVNGDKKPNTFGRDVFQFAMTRDGVSPTLSNDCYKTSTGISCAAYIIKNGNMNYLH